VLLIRFVKLLERYSKKLKEHKELSKQYIEIVMRLLDCWGKAPSQIMLKQNILLILKNFKRILMSWTAFYVMPLALKRKKVLIYKSDTTSSIYGQFVKIRPSCLITYTNYLKMHQTGVYPSSFSLIDVLMNALATTSQLFNNYYHHIHHKDCKYHGISPTLVLNGAVLDHATHLNCLLVKAFLKFKGTEENTYQSSFVKFMSPQFFFYVVIIILEDIGLYPILHGESKNYSWELSEEKNLPPSNYNFLCF
jgi:hypothetical protein